MSKRKRDASERSLHNRSLADRLESSWKLVITSLFDFLSQFGFPGIVMMLVYYFLSNSASDEQKREIIDAYFLLKGKGNSILVIFALVLFAFLVHVGSRHYFRKQITFKDKRIAELNDEKMLLQQKLFKKTFQRSKSKPKKHA